MSNISLLDFESLISISSEEDGFYVLVSTIQSLFFYLKDNYSSKRVEKYSRFMAHLFKTSLNIEKQNFLRNHLTEMIIHHSKDEFAARYFQDRASQLDMLNLLRYHHKLTGKLLVLTNVDYSQEKFKVKQVQLPKN